MELHPSLADLAPLLGTWRGRGHGEYPTISDFDYTDEWEFVHVGKPFLRFTQRTWNAEGQPMHTEVGFLRAVGPGQVEIVAALPTGQSESGTGTWVRDGVRLTLTTDATVVNTPTAKTVDQIVRRLELDGDSLRLELDMAAVGQGLTLHLTSELTRS